MSRATHLEAFKRHNECEASEEGARRIICSACGRQFFTASSWQRPLRRCAECWIASHYMRMDAMTAVARAIKLGRLLPAYTFQCTDCENWASVYDHRDYRKPLAVEPVCQSCNMLRGPAHPFRSVADKDTVAA